MYERTAGEDQLPQDRANVTSGSENSNPNVLLAVFSSLFPPFANVWGMKSKKFEERIFIFQLEKSRDWHEMDTTYVFWVVGQSQDEMFYSYCI